MNVETIKKIESFNCHFTGAPIWDLFCRDFEKIEKSYNTSIRKMLNLPRETHKYFIEPLSEKKHINGIIYKRFLNFTKQIQKSSKKLPKTLFKLVKNDVSSVTGSNLRNIMLVMGKSRIEDLEPDDACNIKYNPVKDENKWKIEVGRELLEV